MICMFIPNNGLKYSRLPKGNNTGKSCFLLLHTIKYCCYCKHVIIIAQAFRLETSKYVGVRQDFFFFAHFTLNPSEISPSLFHVSDYICAVDSENHTHKFLNVIDVVFVLSRPPHIFLFSPAFCFYLEDPCRLA